VWLGQGAGEVAAAAERLSPLRSGRPGSVAQLALGTGRDAGWGRVGAYGARWLTSISKPFGCRVSGDVAGAGARVSGHWRCGDGHQPG